MEPRLPSIYGSLPLSYQSAIETDQTCADAASSASEQAFDALTSDLSSSSNLSFMSLASRVRTPERPRPLRRLSFSLATPPPPSSPIEMAYVSHNSHSEIIASTKKRSASPLKPSKRVADENLINLELKKIQSPNLISALEPAELKIVNEDGFFKKGEKIFLNFVGSGKHHKCWVTEYNGRKIAIKTFIGTINDKTKSQVFLDTITGYFELKDRSDLSVAKLLMPERVPLDGFYVYEFIEGPAAKWCTVVENFFVRMIRGQSQMVEDFRPPNVKIVNDKIVIVDVSTLLDKSCSLELYLTTLLPTWAQINGKTNNEKLLRILGRINSKIQERPLDEKHQNIWSAVLEKLKPI